MYEYPSKEGVPLKQACNQVDVDVGARLRARRLQMRLSQEDVGRALAISYQQVQKYEAGMNRLAPSKILVLSKLLEVEPAFFFVEGDADAAASVETIVPAIESDSDWVRLNQAFRRIDNPSLRRKVVMLVKGVADAGEDDDDPSD